MQVQVGNAKVTVLKIKYNAPVKKCMVCHMSVTTQAKLIIEMSADLELKNNDVIAPRIQGSSIHKFKKKVAVAIPNGDSDVSSQSGQSTVAEMVSNKFTKFQKRKPADLDVGRQLDSSTAIRRPSVSSSVSIRSNFGGLNPEKSILNYQNTTSGGIYFIKFVN